MKQEVISIDCDRLDEKGLMKECFFLITRKIFVKFHEKATKQIIEYHISQRRLHIKNNDKKAAAAQDTERLKWLHLVDNVLNSNIYGCVDITKDCFTASEYMHGGELRK